MAAADSRPTIAPLGATFAAPPGWVFAKEATLTLALHDDTGSALALVGTSSNQPDAVLAAIRLLAERLAITEIREDGVKKRLGRPEAEWATGSAPARLWEIRKGAWPQLKDPVRGTREGAVLLAVIELTPEQVIVALAFQANDVEGEPMAVKAAIESVRAP